jgi:hypothetical protein
VLDVTPYLLTERSSLLELLRALTPDQWETHTECPEWDVKGIALHVLGDDLSLLSRQRDVATNSLALFTKEHPDAPFRQLLDGFNNQCGSLNNLLSPEAQDVRTPLRHLLNRETPLVEDALGDTRAGPDTVSRLARQTSAEVAPSVTPSVKVMAPLDDRVKLC